MELTAGDYLVIALAACTVALFVGIARPTAHDCSVANCPHKQKGGRK